MRSPTCRWINFKGELLVELTRWSGELKVERLPPAIQHTDHLERSNPLPKVNWFDMMNLQLFNYPIVSNKNCLRERTRPEKRDAGVKFHLFVNINGGGGERNSVLYFPRFFLSFQDLIVLSRPLPYFWLQWGIHPRDFPCTGWGASDAWVNEMREGQSFQVDLLFFF